MSRSKRTSPMFAYLQRRFYALAGIEPDFDFGNGISAKNLSKLLDNSRKKLDAFNNKLAEVDEMGQELDQEEAILEDAADRLLGSVTARDGKQGRAFEAVNEVKKTPKKTKKPPKSDNISPENSSQKKDPPDNPNSNVA